MGLYVCVWVYVCMCVYLFINKYFIEHLLYSGHQAGC